MQIRFHVQNRLAALRACGILFALLLSVPGARAQNQVDINFLGMYPQGEFRRQVDRSFGISGGYSRMILPKSPVALLFGGDAGYITYGKNTQYVPYDASNPNYLIGVQINNNFVQFGLTGKAMRSRGSLRPYLEGKVGYSYFFTNAKIVDTQTAYPIDTSGLDNTANTTSYRALGAGLLIPVYTGSSEEGSPGRFAISIDLRFIYWWGDNVDYIPRGSISINPDTNTLDYSTVNTRTNMTSFHIGAAVDF